MTPFNFNHKDFIMILHAEKTIFSNNIVINSRSLYHQAKFNITGRKSKYFSQEQSSLVWATHETKVLYDMISNFNIVYGLSSITNTFPDRISMKPVRNAQIVSSAKASGSQTLVAAEFQTSFSSQMLNGLWSTHPATTAEYTIGESNTFITVSVPASFTAVQALSHLSNYNYMIKQNTIKIFRLCLQLWIYFSRSFLETLTIKTSSQINHPKTNFGNIKAVILCKMK